MTDPIEAVCKAIQTLAIEQAASTQSDCSPLTFILNRSDLFAQAAYDTIIKALIDGAGELVGELNALADKYHLRGGCVQTELDRQAAATIAALRADNARAREEGVRLKTALHDAIRRPMGVVPASADEFYSPDEADAAEQRRATRATAPDLIAGDALIAPEGEG